MSGGKRFSADQVLSAEERLDEMERKYSVIQERIQAYDQIINEFEILKKESKELKSHCNQLENLTAKESGNLLSKIVELSNYLDQLKKSNENNYSIIQQFGTNHILQINKINEDINNYTLGLRDLSKDANENNKRIDVLSKSVSLLNSSLKTTSNKVEDFSESLANIAKKHDSLKKEISTVSASNIAFSQQSEHLIHKIPDFKDWASQVLVKTDASLQDVRLELKNKISTGIENVRTELKEDPLTVDFIKKEFKNSLESLALDSKNAYLKSNNSSQQIQLLEKKIENINLTLKKYELSK